MDTCKQMQVIESTLSRRGKGIVGDPIRVVTQYWSLEGQLLAEVDPCKPGELNSFSTTALIDEVIKRKDVDLFIVESNEKIYGSFYDHEGHVTSNNKKFQIQGPGRVLLISD